MALPLQSTTRRLHVVFRRHTPTPKCVPTSRRTRSLGRCLVDPDPRPSRGEAFFRRNMAGSILATPRHVLDDKLDFDKGLKEKVHGGDEVLIMQRARQDPALYR